VGEEEKDAVERMLEALSDLLKGVSRAEPLSQRRLHPSPPVSRLSSGFLLPSPRPASSSWPESLFFLDVALHLLIVG